MYKFFNSINSRFLKGDLVYWHFGEIKGFPLNSFDKPYGIVQNNQESGDKLVKVLLYE